ncbi:MAG: hypothetical protein AAFX81_16005 [Pseudomonadota bacterium]
MTELHTVTAPTWEPIDLPAARQQLRLPADYTGEDVVLQRCIQAARRQVEKWTWRRLPECVLGLALPAFPVGGVRLETAPVGDVEDVTYRVDGGAEPAVASPADYELRGGEAQPVLVWTGATPPLAVVRQPFEARFRAGYADAATLATHEPDLVNACYLLMTHFFQTRGEQQVGTIVSPNALTAKDICADRRLVAYGDGR